MRNRWIPILFRQSDPLINPVRKLLGNISKCLENYPQCARLCPNRLNRSVLRLEFPPRKLTNFMTFKTAVPSECYSFIALCPPPLPLQLGVLVAIGTAWPSPDKFYKRKSQEKHCAHRRKVSDFPACLIERGCFLPSAPWTRFIAQPITAVWIFFVSGFHPVFSTKPVHSETHKQCGCQVPTMVLSEALGLSLFRVIREGLGSSKRLCVRATQRLSSQCRLALEPECLRNRLTTAGKSFQG